MNDAFDIDTLQTTDTDEMVIKHPVTGEPTTWVWTLAGPGHVRSIEAANAAARSAMLLQKQREQAIVNRKAWKEPDRTPDEVRMENARSFAARVLGWTPARINKEDYPFSTENVVALLLNPSYGRLYLQLLEYFQADDSFTKRSEETSVPSPSANSN